VELIGHYGGDVTHALSAWTSTFRILNEKKIARIPKLLQILADEEHGTPFEKSTIHFLVRTDIATHIHLLKHRVGVSINAESARYKELKDDSYYTPVDWDEEELASLKETADFTMKQYHESLHRLLNKGVPLKRAKESARLHLPYCKQLTSDVMFNWRSFYHFLHLRYSRHAQLEVREVARKMLEQIATIPGSPFKKTMRAFYVIDDAGKLCEPF